MAEGSLSKMDVKFREGNKDKTKAAYSSNIEPIQENNYRKDEEYRTLSPRGSRVVSNIPVTEALIKNFKQRITYLI